jgi:hypothetical protein
MDRTPIGLAVELLTMVARIFITVVHVLSQLFLYGFTTYLMRNSMVQGSVLAS